MSRRTFSRGEVEKEIVKEGAKKAMKRGNKELLWLAMKRGNKELLWLAMKRGNKNYCGWQPPNYLDLYCASGQKNKKLNQY
jgi:hypothetical protein